MKLYCSLLLILLAAACSPVPAGIPVTSRTDNQVVKAGGVPACAYIPGVSIPVKISPEAASLPSAPVAPPLQQNSTSVDNVMTARQIDLYREVMKTIQDKHVYSTRLEKGWLKYHQKNEALIRGGMDDETFYRFLSDMIANLDNGASQFFSPSTWQLKKNTFAATTDFVGIGGIFFGLEQPEPVLVLTGVLPGSPAEEAGLRSHDVIRSVDGGPVYDVLGRPATFGPDGSSLTLMVQTPGQQPREIQVKRSRVRSNLPMPFCLVSGTRIGYIHLLGYNDSSFLRQITETLGQMTSEGLLEGLVIDTRNNNGSSIDTIQQLLSLFTQGDLGSFVSRDGERPFSVLSPLDYEGSQTVPLVVLQDETSGTLAQLFAGVLQQQERAVIVGQLVKGPFYAADIFEFRDGSALILSTAVFRPSEGTGQKDQYLGITPDIVMQSRWDLFTDENDPLVAKAVELLTQKGGNQ